MTEPQWRVIDLAANHPARALLIAKREEYRRRLATDGDDSVFTITQKLDSIAKIRVVSILLDTGHVDRESALQSRDDEYQATIDSAVGIALQMGWSYPGFPDVWHAKVATALGVVHTYVTGEGETIGGTGITGDEDPFRDRPSYFG